MKKTILFAMLLVAAGHANVYAQTTEDSLRMEQLQEACSRIRKAVEELRAN